MLKAIKKDFIKILILPALVSMVFVSCEEDPSDIGEGILPQSDFDSIVGVDTMSVDMYTVYSDSGTSVVPSRSYLGGILDPYFGLTKADFVNQLWLSQAWPGEGFSVDSVKMRLDITDVIGEMVGTGTLNIYDTDEFLSPDKRYLVNRDVPIKEMLASLEIPPFPEGTDTVITLDLPVSFGNYLLRDTSMLYLRSDTLDFRNYINGLYFEYPQSEPYHMMEVNVRNGSSIFEVYYTTASGNDMVYQFLMNEKCLSYNRFLHDYDQADPQKKIKYINEPVRDTLAYVQPMEGVYTKVQIPALEYLRTLPGLAINKARLYLPVYLNNNDYTEDMVPSNILVRYDSAGVKRILTDYLIESSGTFLDGSYNKVTNQYKVNISSFVQEYYEGDILDPEIEIYLPELGTKSLIVKANRDTEDAVRFELVYTVLGER